MARTAHRVARSTRSTPLFAVGSLLIAWLMVSPASASLPRTRTFSAPFPAGRTVANENISSSGGSVGIVSRVAANATTGNVTMAMNASGGVYGSASVTQQGGFRQAFKVSVTAVYNISANWTVSWAATGSYRCAGPPGCSTTYGWGDASVFAILDISGFHGIHGSGQFAHVSEAVGGVMACRSCSHSARGSGNFTVYTDVRLIAGHWYTAKTLLLGTLNAYSVGVAGTASLAMAAPLGGGTLNRITVR